MKYILLPIILFPLILFGATPISFGGSLSSGINFNRFESRTNELTSWEFRNTQDSCAGLEAGYENYFASFHFGINKFDSNILFSNNKFIIDNYFHFNKTKYRTVENMDTDVGSDFEGYYSNVKFNKSYYYDESLKIGYLLTLKDPIDIGFISIAPINYSGMFLHNNVNEFKSGIGIGMVPYLKYSYCHFDANKSILPPKTNKAMTSQKNITSFYSHISSIMIQPIISVQKYSQLLGSSIYFSIGAGFPLYNYGYYYTDKTKLSEISDHSNSDKKLHETFIKIGVIQPTLYYEFEICDYADYYYSLGDTPYTIYDQNIKFILSCGVRFQ